MGKVFRCSSLGGELEAPSSKSYAHRLYICAALSKEATRVICSNGCSDIMSTKRCLTALGAKISGDEITPICRNALPLSPVLDCGDSGSTLRFLMPVVSALGCGAEFNVSEGLAARPMDALKSELIRHGASIRGNQLLPSDFNGNSFVIPGDVSSQFISGLLLALPIGGGGEVNITTNLQSSRYVDITIDCLRDCGIYVNRIDNKIIVSGEYNLQGCHSVEGDWSSAAFWLCAGVVGRNAVTVNGLKLNSLQGDKTIVDILKAFGADLCFGEGSVTVYPSELESIAIDAAEIPDLIPALSVVCAAAKGESRIYNARRLRYKESDRLHSIYVMLTSLGADVTELTDGLIIRGGKHLNGGKVCSFADHRIAMSAAIASCICDGDIEIDDTDCIQKSYPDFMKDFISLGGIVNEQV